MNLTGNEKVLVISGVRRKFLEASCGCGKLFWSRQDHLKREKYPVTNCGCEKWAYKSGRKASNLKPQGEAAARNVYNSYKSKCFRKGVTFHLTFEDFKEITKKNCFYCGVEPKQMYKSLYKYGPRAGLKKVNGDYIYNGIDRVVPSLGYVAGNIRPCCKTCNVAKGDKNEAEFYEWITKLVEYHGAKRTV